MVVFIIHLFGTFVHGFVFKTYTPLSTILVFIIVCNTIWSYIIPNWLLLLAYKSNVQLKSWIWRIITYCLLYNYLMYWEKKYWPSWNTDIICTLFGHALSLKVMMLISLPIRSIGHFMSVEISVRAWTLSMSSNPTFLEEWPFGKQLSQAGLIFFYFYQKFYLAMWNYKTSLLPPVVHFAAEMVQSYIYEQSIVLVDIVFFTCTVYKTTLVVLEHHRIQNDTQCVVEHSILKAIKDPSSFASSHNIP